MRFAVYGTGGVGGYFGGRLARAGHEVVFVARGEHLRAIREHGLRVDSLLGDFMVAPARATDDPSEIGEVDVVLLGVKAWQVGDAAKAIRPLIGRESCVLPLQNGVEAPDRLAEALGAAHVLGGLCAVFCYIAGPGHIRHVGVKDPSVTLGELDDRPSGRTDALVAAFGKAGVSAGVAPDIRAALWQKLMIIGSVGGIGAVARVPAGIWRAVPETRGMYEAAVREACEVARAAGVALTEDQLRTALDMPDYLEPTAIASLQRDIAEGRRSELEEQIGVIVRTGRAAGVTPSVYEFIYNSLLPAERAARGSLPDPG